jgi:DMSO reductase anchor subunit
MLTLMPMAVGCFTIQALAHPASISLVLTGWIAAAAGLAASVFHLGKPLRAWRVFLGLRKSWLSREAVVFGLWFSLASGYTSIVFSPTAVLIVKFSGLSQETVASLGAKLLPVCVAVGLIGLFCSVMIYVDTQRPFWRFSQTAPRFFGTAFVLGLATALCAKNTSPAIAAGLVLATLFKLAIEARPLRVLDDDDETLTPERKTALLLTETSLRSVLSLRYFLALFAGILLPITFMSMHLSTSWAWLALAGLMGAEVAERYLYFRAVVAPKMPGVLNA